MDLIITIVCFILGCVIGIAIRGEFTINYNHIYKDETMKFTEVKDPIGYNTENKLEDVDTPAEIAAKIQEAIGVFMDDESEERK